MNIVETVDLVQDESQRWCEVMEFCPGGDLYAAIKRGRMSPSEVECCFKQILTGVTYLHNQGVAHRDIKPENLFFDLKGHLKVLDPVVVYSILLLTPFRSETMGLPPCTDCLGKARSTCLLAYVGANHTLLLSSSWENVSRASPLHEGVVLTRWLFANSLRRTLGRHLGLWHSLLLSPLPRDAVEGRADV